MNQADTGQAPAGAMTRETLLDLMRPVDEAVREWPRKTGRAARNRVLDAVRAGDLSYQSWDEATWAEVSRTAGPARLHIAGGEQPWKYYDLGEGYCSCDFFAKCPHRLACARCPFYVPKQSTRGQLLAVRDGIDQMLEQLDLTDEEREALEGDREAVTALAERLADTPTPAGSTPRELGTSTAFISMTRLTNTITPKRP
ncbi:hypothetical protein [Streptomyces sp. NPDC056660]|uniref:hypothetical protein n=1 Tax=Streptomyces sp. NPDC056660 TaxID=3345897 RepID=UPI0036BCA836